MSKELVNKETGEIVDVPTNNVVRETDEYMIVKLENGKFEKRMKYKPIATFVPETEEQEIELYKVFNEEGFEKVVPLKQVINQEFNIVDFITRPYESFDEDTGDVNFGVVTTMLTDDDKYLTTSSKSVYYDLLNMYDVFKLPLRVKVTGVRREYGTQIGLSLIGRAKLEDVPF